MGSHPLDAITTTVTAEPIGKADVIEVWMIPIAIRNHKPRTIGLVPSDRILHFVTTTIAEKW